MKTQGAIVISTDGQNAQWAEALPGNGEPQFWGKKIMVARDAAIQKMGNTTFQPIPLQEVISKGIPGEGPARYVYAFIPTKEEGTHLAVYQAGDFMLNVPIEAVDGELAQWVMGNWRALSIVESYCQETMICTPTTGQITYALAQFATVAEGEALLDKYLPSLMLLPKVFPMKSPKYPATKYFLSAQYLRRNGPNLDMDEIRIFFDEDTTGKYIPYMNIPPYRRYEMPLLAGYNIETSEHLVRQCISQNREAFTAIGEIWAIWNTANENRNGLEEGTQVATDQIYAVLDRAKGLLNGAFKTSAWDTLYSRDYPMFP